MKKHPFIQVELTSSVKLSRNEEKKLSEWLRMASLVMEDLIKKHKIIHPTWIQKLSLINVSVLICGEARIKKLNADHRNLNKVTDVLSFPNHDSLRTSKPQGEPNGREMFLGDLAICHQKTIKQAKAFDISYWDEFIHLFMHGMIHLIGYDHEVSQKEEKLMEEWEKRALDQFSALKNKTKKKGP